MAKRMRSAIVPLSEEERVLIKLIGHNRRLDDVTAMMATDRGRAYLRREVDGRLPLHGACWRRHGIDAPFDLVEAMVKVYPKAVRLTSSTGGLPLHYACDPSPWSFNVSPQVVRLLLDAYPEGAKVKDIRERRLPLHYAAKHNAPLEVLEMLLEAHPRGAATRENDGELPLHFLANAASHDEKEKIKLLMRPLLENDDACLVSNPPGIRKTALDIGVEFDVLHLHTCVRIPRCPARVIVKVAQRHPEQLRMKDESGNLPLHVAAANSNLNGAHAVFEDVIVKLVRLHPDSAAASDGQGRFPLVLAIESGKKFNEGVEALVDAAEHVITLRDVETNLFPFMLASTVDDPCITTIYSILRRCPELKRYALN